MFFGGYNVILVLPSSDKKGGVALVGPPTHSRRKKNTLMSLKVYGGSVEPLLAGSQLVAAGGVPNPKAGLGYSSAGWTGGWM